MATGKAQQVGDDTGESAKRFSERDRVGQTEVARQIELAVIGSD